MWNPVRAKQLRDARDAAIRERRTAFNVELDGQGKHDFTVAESGHTLQWLEREFAANPPQPRRPHNEGEEGQ